MDLFAEQVVVDVASKWFHLCTHERMRQIYITILPNVSPFVVAFSASLVGHLAFFAAREQQFHLSFSVSQPCHLRFANHRLIPGEAYAAGAELAAFAGDKLAEFAAFGVVATAAAVGTLLAAVEAVVVAVEEVVVAAVVVVVVAVVVVAAVVDTELVAGHTLFAEIELMKVQLYQIREELLEVLNYSYVEFQCEMELEAGSLSMVDESNVRREDEN